MFQNYTYEKPAFIGRKDTDALTAAFAGGGWLHLNDHLTEEEKKQLPYETQSKEVFQ